MKLSHRKYDLIWASAVALTTLAVVAADGHLHVPKWSIVACLVSALLIAGALSLFVTRINDTDFEAEAVPKSLVETVDQAKPAVKPFEVPNLLFEFGSGQHEIDVLDRLIMPPDAQFAHWTVDVDLPRSVLLGTKSVLLETQSLSRSILLETQTLLRRYAAEQEQMMQRRNIIYEASEIAKHLSGFGKEIVVTTDNAILIRDCKDMSSSTPVEERSSEKPNDSWLN